MQHQPQQRETSGWARDVFTTRVPELQRRHVRRRACKWKVEVIPFIIMIMSVILEASHGVHAEKACLCQQAIIHNHVYNYVLCTPYIMPCWMPTRWQPTSSINTWPWPLWHLEPVRQRQTGRQTQMAPGMMHHGLEPMSKLPGEYSGITSMALGICSLWTWTAVSTPRAK